VVKHAHGATQVTVRVSQEGGQLCLRVRDDAPGPAVSTRPGGHGLANMRRRAEAAGGALHHVAEATGFGVVACLPG
jgi:signal transduction histidine kinase